MVWIKQGWECRCGCHIDTLLACANIQLRRYLSPGLFSHWEYQRSNYLGKMILFLSPCSPLWMGDDFFWNLHLIFNSHDCLADTSLGDKTGKDTNTGKPFTTLLKTPIVGMIRRHILRGLSKIFMVLMVVSRNISNANIGQSLSDWAQYWQWNVLQNIMWATMMIICSCSSNSSMAFRVFQSLSILLRETIL